MIAMDVDFKNMPPRAGSSQQSTLVVVAAYALVIFVFILDWITPALVAVGMAYEAPVVLAGLRGSRQLTIQMLVLGSVGLVIGWYMDLAADSFHLNDERIENRLLSLMSLLVVACLTLMIQKFRDAGGRRDE